MVHASCMHAAYVTWGDGAGDILIDNVHGVWSTPPGRLHPALPAGTQAGRARSHDIMASHCAGVPKRKIGLNVIEFLGIATLGEPTESRRELIN